MWPAVVYLTLMIGNDLFCKKQRLPYEHMHSLNRNLTPSKRKSFIRVWNTLFTHFVYVSFTFKNSLSTVYYANKVHFGVKSVFCV